MMKIKTLISIVGLGILLFLLVACQQPQIETFEECVEAGNPIMESYPRQCRAQGETFIEELKQPPEFMHCPTGQQGVACTSEYDPVCAIMDNNIRCITEPCPSTDAITMGNGCTACLAGAYGYYKSACEEQLFVVCKDTVTGFDPVQFARDAGGICVDICPNNFDAFTTQTGIELCIPHYGVEEIERWQLCDRSSANCNCVKAYETTEGQSINDAQYRCVPEMYAERMLFRGGQYRLDEDGEQSIIIA